MKKTTMTAAVLTLMAWASAQATTVYFTGIVDAAETVVLDPNEIPPGTQIIHVGDLFVPSFTFDRRDGVQQGDQLIIPAYCDGFTLAGVNGN